METANGFQVRGYGPEGHEKFWLTKSSAAVCSDTMEAAQPLREDSLILHRVALGICQLAERLNAPWTLVPELGSWFQAIQVIQTDQMKAVKNT